MGRDPMLLVWLIALLALCAVLWALHSQWTFEVLLAGTVFLHIRRYVRRRGGFR